MKIYPDKRFRFKHERKMKNKIFSCAHFGKLNFEIFFKDFIFQEKNAINHSQFFLSRSEKVKDYHTSLSIFHNKTTKMTDK